MDFMQCTMERKEGETREVLTSWLPQKFAKKGKVLKLQCRETGVWKDGWLVKRVDKQHPLAEEIVIQRSQLCKGKLFDAYWEVILGLTLGAFGRKILTTLSGRGERVWSSPPRNFTKREPEGLKM